MPIRAYGECFRALGAPLGQDVHAWSSRSGNTVVLALWVDQFDLSVDPPTHSTFDPGPKLWTTKARNLERLSHLVHAETRCEGLVSAFVSVAVASETKTEVAASVYIPGLKLKVRKLDRKTGEFEAEVVQPDAVTLRREFKPLLPRA